MLKQYGSVAWALFFLIALVTLISPARAIAGESPASVGPQGFVIWETHRDLPELAFNDEENKPVTLADFRGKVVLLNIWATWCVPCRKEMPTLDALQAELGSGQFEVVALSIDHAGIGVVGKFYRETGVRHLRKFIDPSMQSTSTLGIDSVPTTLLIGHDGREIGRLVGASEWNSQAMMDLITRAIDEIPD